MRRKRWALALVAIPLFALIFVAGFGFAVHELWNLLMPELFHLPVISFWQAVGLLSLSWLLFGGWRGMPRRHGGWGGHHRRERWERLTPEERERFQSRMASCRSRRYGRDDAPEAPAP